MLKWWAYIHSHDKAIHLKRWFPVSDWMCDLEYVREEKFNGNDNMAAMVPAPFDADSSEEAMEKAKKIFSDMGYVFAK